MTDLSGVEATTVLAAWAVAILAGRRAGRYWRWVRAEARRRRDWLAQTEAAYRAEIGAARTAAAARAVARAAAEPGRELAARQLRPVGTPIEVLR